MWVAGFELWSLDLCGKHHLEGPELFYPLHMHAVLWKVSPKIPVLESSLLVRFQEMVGFYQVEPRRLSFVLFSR